MTSPALIEAQDVSFRYDGDLILEGVSLRVEEGDFIGLIGPNGGGKTTLLKILLGLLVPQHGRVRVMGRTPREVSSQIGYVPQQIHFDKEFPISVLEVVLLGCLGRSPYFGGYRPRERETAEQALREVDLLPFRHRRFGTLSGGQRQRVLIARALAGRPRLLVMDEPTANVDSLSQQQIYDLLHQINEKCTIILVSHDLGVVSAHVTRVACLNRRMVIHPTTAITDSMIQDIYQSHVHLVNHGNILPPGNEPA